MKAAILIHGFDWKSKEDKILLREGLYLEKFENSKAEILYEKLCIERKVHDGEPFFFGFAVIMEDNWLDESFPYWNKSFSTISATCNLVAICTGNIIAFYSLLLSNDDFLSGNLIDIHHDYELNDALTMNDDNYAVKIKDLLKQSGYTFKLNSTINDKVINRLKIATKNFMQFGANPRINNAFSFYFSSWRSHQMEHICINLSIILESLFTPSDNIELTHQISFNVSHFLGKNNETRKKIYLLIKKFYSIRSKIVHGGSPKFEELYIITPTVFILCSEILRKLLGDIALLEIFSDNKKRDELIQAWLFN